MLITCKITRAIEEGRACECCKSYFLDKDGKEFKHDEPGPYTCKNCWIELTPLEKSLKNKADKRTV